MIEVFAPFATVEVMPGNGLIQAGLLARHCKQQWPRPPDNPLIAQPGQELELVLQFGGPLFGLVGWSGWSQAVIGLWYDGEGASRDRYDRILKCYAESDLTSTVPLRAFPVGGFVSDHVCHLDAGNVETWVASWSAKGRGDTPNVDSMLDVMEQDQLEILLVLRTADRYVAIEVARSGYNPASRGIRLRNQRTASKASLLSLAVDKDLHVA
jgi:hypothetical protein